MTEITKTFLVIGEEAQVLAQIALVARARGYTSNITLPDNSKIPNTKTQDQYVLEGIKAYLSQTAEIQNIQEKTDSVRVDAKAETDAISNAITVTQGA